MKKNHATDYTTPDSIAAIWSMMLPGLGQMMKGRIMPGIIWAIVVASGYFSYFWPGLLLHATCIIDAALMNEKGSLISLDSWPKRVGLVAVISSLLVYIVVRNGI
jgi:TM2 domain-containing membrane protein YozV